jgi:hypothetical protein
MFAPYCPTCASRVLMTTRRIVRFTSAETGMVDVILRCYCGTEVPAEGNPPHPHQGVPTARAEFTRSAVAAAG